MSILRICFVMGFVVLTGMGLRTCWDAFEDIAEQQ